MIPCMRKCFRGEISNRHRETGGYYLVHFLPPLRSIINSRSPLQKCRPIAQVSGSYRGGRPGRAPPLMEKIENIIFWKLRSRAFQRYQTLDISSNGSDATITNFSHWLYHTLYRGTCPFRLRPGSPRLGILDPPPWHLYLDEPLWFHSETCVYISRGTCLSKLKQAMCCLK